MRLHFRSKRLLRFIFVSFLLFVFVVYYYLFAVASKDLPIADHLKKKNIDKASSLLSTSPSPVVERYKEQPVHYNVHVFYYPWYGTPEFDKKWLHWNHKFLLHWNEMEAKRWPQGQHNPPDDIGANFYPSLGPYSSRDPAVIENHMIQIRSAGIGVLGMSWYPPGLSDDQGIPFDDLVPLVMDAADKHKLKVTLHIEPYKDRNSKNMRQWIKYIIKRYGSHPAFYRMRKGTKELPLFYIYDSYQVTDWKNLFDPSGSETVRNTELDAIYIGLLVQPKHLQELAADGFDGVYTYFATDGFTYGSSQKLWPVIAKQAQDLNLLFIPSVGPGYIDTRVRPWNPTNSRDRRNGTYYTNSFRTAISTKPSVISITSFNEWHEGTQIERAVPRTYKSYTYMDYAPHKPDYYLTLTRQLTSEYATVSSGSN